MPTNPYKKLPSGAFWRPTVGDRSPFDINDIWDPKFDIRPNQAVSTYGSCFAQHIGEALETRGYSRLVTEPAPWGMKNKNARAWNYGIFTARTGNIYTTSLLRQWVNWSLGHETMPEEYWYGTNGELIDPFRPTIEPDGFTSIDELHASRKQTLASFKASIRESRYFVFTMGLTESWFHGDLGYEYPICPGTVAGKYDETVHKFRNQRFHDVLTNLRDAMQLMRSENQSLRFLLTVSPVPLTATYSGNNVVM